MPCGRCRQLLWEHGGATMLIDTARGVLAMSAVLPDAFGPEDLQTHAADSERPEPEQPEPERPDARRPNSEEQT